MSFVLAGSSFYAPVCFLSSAAFEELLTPLYLRLKLPKGRLEEMTGIRQRGHYPTYLPP